MKILKLCFINIIIIISFVANFQSFAQEKSKRTLLETDTRNSDAGEVQYNPNANKFSPQQDSLYYRALRLNIPLTTRFKFELQYSNIQWELRKEMSKGKSLKYAFKELQKNYPDILMPSEVDVVHREAMITNSFMIPYSTSYFRNGARFQMESVGRLLGITKDYRPIIQYTIDYNAEVQVVVYSVSASVIATVFDGKQKPGNYEIAWNGRDDNGKKMPTGDYIMEVRIGSEKFIRKKVILKN